MHRIEVRKIGEIIANACWEKYPKAEISTMGSYRRGKEYCGDVDVLITHSKYVQTTPEGALDELEECLFNRGYISHNLTKVNDAGLTKMDLVMLDLEKLPDQHHIWEYSIHRLKMERNDV